MSVRSGTPFWRIIHPTTVTAPSLSDEIQCEVVVLGGGITGALVAHRLVDEGVDTVLIDRGDLGCGSTAASTGLLQYEIDTSLTDLIGKVGQANAVRAYRRGLTAIDQIEELVEQLSERCGFGRRDTLYFASSFWHRRRLQREYQCRHEHGFNVELLHRDDIAGLFSIPASLAILSHGDAKIDPYLLTQRLLVAARSKGLRAFCRTSVCQIDEAADQVTLKTPQGRVTARFIVYATGYDIRQHLPADTGSFHSTYAVVSEPLADFTGWHNHCLIWETARPYFYARQTDDGRAMIGGEDTPFSDDHERDGQIEAKTDRLAARFTKLFPSLKFVPACAWAGTFGETKDGLAYIGSPPGRDRAYFALGYGGNGITFSMIAARLIADLYLGRPNPDAEVFRFGR